VAEEETTPRIADTSDTMVRLYNPVTNKFQEIDDYDYFDITGTFPKYHKKSKKKK